MEEKKKEPKEKRKEEDTSIQNKVTLGFQNGGEGKNKNVDRISLKPESIARVDHWISQIKERHQSVRISRNAVVNFILLQRAPNLSDDEIEQLGGAHRDDIRFAMWAVKAMREARSRGERYSLRSLMEKERLPMD